MCPCVCVQELPPAANASARSCAARGGLSSTFPQGNHEGGTKGAIVVAASMRASPLRPSPSPRGARPGIAVDLSQIFREEEPVFPRSCPNPEPLEEQVTAGTLPMVGDPILASRCWPQLWPSLRVVGVFVFI